MNHIKIGYFWEIYLPVFSSFDNTKVEIILKKVSVNVTFHIIVILLRTIDASFIAVLKNLNPIIIVNVIKIHII